MSADDAAILGRDGRKLLRLELWGLAWQALSPDRRVRLAELQQQGWTLVQFDAEPRADASEPWVALVLRRPDGEQAADMMIAHWPKESELRQ